MLRIGIVALAATLGACGLTGSQAERENTPAAAAKQRSQQKPTGAPVWKKLTREQARVIEQCGTERPFSGKFVKHKANGTYTCARCGAPLFSSKAKFDSGTGWPSFDDALPGAVREKKDPDGRRTEIVCGRCGGHLGLVFRGERMTIKNTRHCVNSLALGFAGGARAEAFFAGGCFWGVEHLMEKMPGVLSAQSGYMGGHVDRPTYRQVVSGRTGHAETVRIIFDPSKVTYEKLARMFFEIHDPTQVDRQGPDRGTQYRSAVFVTDAKQRETIEKLIKLLAGKGYKVATKIHPAAMFWPAEAYHQDYYRKTGKAPYCHAHTSRF